MKSAFLGGSIIAGVGQGDGESYGQKYYPGWGMGFGTHSGEFAGFHGGGSGWGSAIMQIGYQEFVFFDHHLDGIGLGSDLSQYFGSNSRRK